MEKKYYWLKLKRDFFKRHDIRIIEAMPNGKDYILFYLKLLCESVDHEGKLRFSESVPYNAEMLSIITDTNRDTVQAAVDIFVELGMMEKLDDGTLYMTECQKLIGCETAWAEKKREYREKLALCTPPEGKIEDIVQEEEDIVLPLSDKSKRKSKSKNKNNNIVEKSTPDSDLKAEFEEIWKEYPKKEGKTNAEKDYLKARKEGVTKEIVLDGIRRYREKVKGEETRYILNGSTYFHQRRWEDEYGKSGESYERHYSSDIYEEVYQ